MSSEASTEGERRWLPLESNPDVLNPFIARLGCPEAWGFTDVYGLDEELLAFLPQPCVALCLLFPSGKICGPRRAELRAKAAANGGASRPKDVFFMQQHDGIGNACGTIACIHAVVNAAASGHFELSKDSALAEFTSGTSDQSSSERGHALASTGAMQVLSNNTAAAGETEGAGTDDAQNSHFICFVHVNGQLYELDGRTKDDEGVAFPVSHGPTSAESFVTDAAKVIRDDFMARDPDNPNFNITALCKLE